MRCPTCKRRTTKTITRFDEEGKAVMRGCPACFRHKARGHIHTGKKIWSGYEAYGVEKTIQKNHDWIEGVAARAAKMRRTAHHSGFHR